MKIPCDHVIIKMVRTINDEYKFKNGKVIYLDTYFDPDQKAKEQIKQNLIVCSEVLEIPQKLADKNRLDAWPVRRANEVIVHRDVYRWYKFDDRFMDSISPEVEKGDIIYFNWTAINDTNLFTLEEDEAYYRVPYPDIICTIKKDKIIPIGGNLLLKPYYGHNVEKRAPISHSLYIDSFGGKTAPSNEERFFSRSEKGILRPVKPMEGFGEIMHAGKTLKGDPEEYFVGDIVKYTVKSGLTINVEGLDYIGIRYWDIIASFEKVA